MAFQLMFWCNLQPLARQRMNIFSNEMSQLKQSSILPEDFEENKKHPHRKHVKFVINILLTEIFFLKTHTTTLKRF